MTKVNEEHSGMCKKATADLYRARERKRGRSRSDPAKLVIQLIALAFLLECLKMRIDVPRDDEALVKMLDAGIDVARTQVALYYEGGVEVWCLEQVVDAVSGILIRCEATGLDLGTM